MPPLFALCDAIVSENCKGIVKDKRSRLKRQVVVLALVDPVLFHRPIQTASLYTMYNTQSGLTERRLREVIYQNRVWGQRDAVLHRDGNMANGLFGCPLHGGSGVILNAAEIDAPSISFEGAKLSLLTEHVPKPARMIGNGTMLSQRSAANLYRCQSNTCVVKKSNPKGPSPGAIRGICLRSCPP